MILGLGDVFVYVLGENEEEVLVFFGCGLASLHAKVKDDHGSTVSNLVSIMKHQSSIC